jgi:hypothetical protein
MDFRAIRAKSCQRGYLSGYKESGPAFLVCLASDPGKRRQGRPSDFPEARCAQGPAGAVACSERNGDGGKRAQLLDHREWV